MFRDRRRALADAGEPGFLIARGCAAVGSILIGERRQNIPARVRAGIVATTRQPRAATPCSTQRERERVLAVDAQRS